MSVEENSEKWTCDYCTYENFPSAVKCTMCRGAHPLLAQTHVSEDILKLQTADELAVKAASPSVWECESCQCANSALAVDCAACGASRDSAILQQRLGALTLGENELADRRRRRRQAPPRKWCCAVCTYENWPRATKCVMCFEDKCTSPPVSGGSALSSPERDIIAKTDEFARVRKTNVIRRIEDLRSTSPNGMNVDVDKMMKIRRNQKLDRPWLNACLGVVNGDPGPVLAYLGAGGDPGRTLTNSEVAVLGRPSAFDVGYTLVHLAIRFNREDLLATLLSHIEGSSSGIKRVPSYVAPDLAADIRRLFGTSICQRKSNFSCPFVNEQTTFFLPVEIEDLPTMIQEQLFQEILDKDVQQQLEANPPVINWSLEITSHLGSRLYALWNRSSGDCLLDSVMQATWGVFDRENTLRRALADAMTNSHSGHMFYTRWREYETMQAVALQFVLEESQWQEDWSGLVALATQPGSSLEQLHVFVLAHIFRRPIVVYGIKYVKSFRGENIGFSNFQGVYLPLLWEPNFCIKSPLALGYTRGHFSALVPMEPEVTNSKSSSELYLSFLPLMDHNHHLLPVHFLSQAELGKEERVLRQWMDVCVTDTGLLIAQQKLQERPLLVAQMLEEWLNYYRRLAQMSGAPFHRPVRPQDYSSDGESDDD